MAKSAAHEGFEQNQWPISRCAGPQRFLIRASGKNAENSYVTHMSACSHDPVIL